MAKRRILRTSIAALFATAREWRDSLPVDTDCPLSIGSLSALVMDPQRYAAGNLMALAAYLEHLHGPGTLHVLEDNGSPGARVVMLPSGAVWWPCSEQGLPYIGTIAAVLPGELAWVVP